MSAEKVRNSETMFHTLTTKPVVALIRICNQSAFSSRLAAMHARKFALAVLNPAKLSKLRNSLRFNSLLRLPSVRIFSRLAFSFLSSPESHVFVFRLGTFDLGLGTKRSRCIRFQPARRAAIRPPEQSRAPVCFR